MVSGGDIIYDIRDTKLSSSVTVNEISFMTTHEISNMNMTQIYLHGSPETLLASSYFFEKPSLSWIFRSKYNAITFEIGSIAS